MKRDWYAECGRQSSLDDDERRCLKRFEMLCKHFARLESLAAGEVRFDLPVDTSARSASLEGTAAKQGERLADLERRRLSLGEDPLDDMVGVLDGMGIKIVCVRMPESSTVSGGFYFDGDVGPCIMVNSSMPVEEQMVSAAHQYCHYVADYNPYSPRLCNWGAPTGEDSSEERAAGFAGAFLLPRGSLETLLSGEDGVGEDETAIEALGIYYGVPVWAVAYRLRSLGVDVEFVGETLPPAGAIRAEPDSQADLPRRMVRLAVEARAGGLVKPLRMARLLQMDVENAEKLYAYFIESVQRQGETDGERG